MMSVLEKILEEIEDVRKIMKSTVATNCFGKECENDDCTVCVCERVIEIIRSHMNDETDTNVGSKSGWIPVGNGLPEKSGWYLVQLSVSIPHEDYADRVVVLYDGEEKVFMCYEKLIVAWQPLPGPYKGEEAAG
jgi:hypothetical protein